MALIPPWEWRVQGRDRVVIEKVFLDYHLIFDPPDYEDVHRKTGETSFGNKGEVRIDFSRLTLQCAAMALVATVAFLALSAQARS
jgi:hypothetical protein